MKRSESSLTDEVFYTQDLQKEHKKALKQSFVANNRDEIYFFVALSEQVKRGRFYLLQQAALQTTTSIQQTRLAMHLQ